MGDRQNLALRYGLLGGGALLASLGGANCVAGYWDAGAWHAGYGGGFVPVFCLLLLGGLAAIVAADRLSDDRRALVALAIPVLLAWPLRGAVVRGTWTVECAMGRPGGRAGKAVVLDRREGLSQLAVPLYARVCRAEPDASRAPDVALRTLEQACTRLAELDAAEGCPDLRDLCARGGRDVPCRAAERLCKP